MSMFVNGVVVIVVVLLILVVVRAYAIVAVADSGRDDCFCC